MAATERLATVLRHPCRSQLVPLGVLSVVSAGATVLSPAIGTGSPLLLVALCPRLPFLLLAAGHASVLPFLAIGTLRLCVGDPFHFQLGKHHGPAAARRVTSWLGRPGRWLRATVRRLGPLAMPAVVLIRPTGRHLALAGASGMSSRLAVVLDVIGTVGYLVLIFTGAAALT